MAFLHDNAIYFNNSEDALDIGKDVSGLEHDADNSTNLPVQVASIGGKTNVMQFDGVDDQVDISSQLVEFASTNNICYAGWIRTTATEGELQAIFSASDSTQASRDLLFYYQDSKLILQVRDSALLFQIESAPITTNNTWVHCAFTTGPSGAEIWIDGTSAGTDVSTISLSTITVDGMRLGYNVDSGGPQYIFEGEQKDVYVGNHELTQNSVDDIFVNNNYGYDIVTLIGQSNMAGRATARLGIDDDYTSVSGLVKQQGYGAFVADPATSLSDATNVLDHNESGFTTTMGPWLGFCNQLVSGISYGRKILLVPTADGGTRMVSQWQPGGANYIAARNSHNYAYARSTLNVVRAIWQIQGESDADDGSLTYQADLQNMYDNMVTGGSSFDGFDAGVPFADVEILGPADNTVDRDAINTAKAGFAAGGATRYLYDTSSLSLFDNYHFDAVSTEAIGVGVAQQVFGAATFSGRLIDGSTGLALADRAGLTYSASSALRPWAEVTGGTFDITGGNGEFSIAVSGISVGAEFWFKIAADDSLSNDLNPSTLIKITTTGS